MAPVTNGDAVDPQRRFEIGTALAAVRGRVLAACGAAGRDPASVQLIAVTKTWPATDVVALYQLGLRDFGESRDQEAHAKVDEVVRLLGADKAAELRWHFVGQLQSRKCRSIASYAAVVHSLDRIELVQRLAAGVQQAERQSMDVFIQISLDADPDRGGVAVDTFDPLDELTDAVAAVDQLRLRGVMAVPPLGTDADTEFARLADIATHVRSRHPGAADISAGMSEDLETAVRHGSTYLRVGSALLGRRPPIFS